VEEESCLQTEGLEEGAKAQGFTDWSALLGTKSRILFDGTILVSMTIALRLPAKTSYHRARDLHLMTGALWSAGGRGRDMLAGWVRGVLKKLKAES